ncbi:hypothetical protein SO802_019054 [Lithocarpus litseifolius]|uniref:Aminotransferase-like plant mobile domain-containing protein n=1 Tax=Lithocarpus litseifolius TaxID=425828 RepID=A0AAW2CMK2_9ROSI
MLGVPIDGLPMTGIVKLEWPVLCRDLLGHRPPDPVPHPHENMSILAGASVVGVHSVYGQVSKPGVGHASIVPEPISDAKRYNWGNGALAWLYRHLCKASEMKAKKIRGALMLVQLWAYSRFPLICPVTRLPQPAVEAGPLARRWKGPKSTTEHATHVLAAYRASLSSIRAHQESYRDVLDLLPPYCTSGRHIWRAIVPLIYFWIVEEHHPERVFRQFGMKQMPPEIVDTSVDLHRISLQGKLERTWLQEHAGYIERWAHREEHVAEAPILDRDTTYLVAYMESYQRMTRRKRYLSLPLDISGSLKRSKDRSP